MVNGSVIDFVCWVVLYEVAAGSCQLVQPPIGALESFFGGSEDTLSLNYALMTLAAGSRVC
jgi:hypothetical protein